MPTDREHLVEMLVKLTEWAATVAPEGEVAHDEEYDRLCDREDPGGCVVCEARALLWELNVEV